MKDYYKNTRQVFDIYNKIMEKIQTSLDETTDDEDEFVANFCLHLAHALIKDTGAGQTSREELCKVADIINTVIV